MSLKVEIQTTAHWNTLLTALEEIVKQQSLNNPRAYEQFCQRDATRLAGLANAVQYILNKEPK